jgi:hypothetical protein
VQYILQKNLTENGHNRWPKHVAGYAVYNTINLHICICTCVGRDSSVGIATRDGLNGPGIESRWGRDFLHLSRMALGPTSLLYNGYRVFSRGKSAGAWRWSPTPPSAKVKDRIELYHYSPCGHSWPVLGWTLPLYNRPATFNHPPISPISPGFEPGPLL